jgi:replicative DNA helicase
LIKYGCEISLITEIILNPFKFGEVSSLLEPEYFGLEDCRKVYRAMQELAEKGEVPEIVLLCRHLESKGMSTHEAALLLDRVTDGAPAYELKKYALMVIEDYKQRKFRELMDDSKDRTDSEAMSDTVNRIFEIQESKKSNEIKTLGEVSPLVLEELYAQRDGDSEKMGLMTGLADIDLATRGINKSEFWVCGAMPGRGKTAFATQVAVEAINRGNGVLFFSLEMTANQLIRRMFGQEFGAASIKNPRSMSAERIRQMAEFAADNLGLPLFIDDSSTLSAADVAMKAKMAIRSRGIALIIVDYLQLLRGQGRELRERVGAAANVLRQLAKDSRVPVLALSQLRRPQNINDVPSMIDLKESGDIEAHANTVLLLYMPIGDDKQPTGEEQVIIGKQRNGPIGSFPVYFDKRTLMFRDRMKREHGI